MPNGAGEAPTVGVLALQGAFEVHQQRLHELGVRAPLIRTASQLATVDALVLPGGESTTMSRLLATSGLFEPLAERLSSGMAVLGTCAGMILCATEVLDGRPDQRSFGVIDISVRRNGYGRQLDSFEADIDLVADLGGEERPFHAVFIRAPLVERIGPGVEVLAVHDDTPVLVRAGRCTVAAFHPELTHDTRIHRSFVDSL